MKNKSILVIVGLLFVIGFLLYLLDHFGNKNDKLQEQIVANEETINNLHGQMDSINFTLANEMEKNEKLQTALSTQAAQHAAEQEVYKRERKELSEKIVVLQTELEPLIAANPRLKLLIEAFEAHEIASNNQIEALEAERDDWKAKFESEQVNSMNILKAKIDTEKALEDSLAAFKECNNQLVDVYRTISRQKKTRGLVLAGGILVGAVVTGVVK